MKADTLSLFDEPARYVIDTNVIVAFLKKSEDEYYGSDVFKPQWALVEDLIERGVIISTMEVKAELEKWCEPKDNPIPEMAQWLKDHAYMFKPVTMSKQLELAQQITDKYEVYGDAKNYLGDLSVITMAGAMGIAVISLEGKQANNSLRRPKIPNVCDEYGVDCKSFSGFLRAEDFGTKT